MAPTWRRKLGNVVTVAKSGGGSILCRFTTDQNDTTYTTNCP